MNMVKDNYSEFADKESKLCAGDTLARHLAWKMKKVKTVPINLLITAKDKDLNDQIDS